VAEWLKARDRKSLEAIPEVQIFPCPPKNGRALRAIVIGRNAKGSLQTHHEAIERPEHGHQKYGAREKKSFTRVISAEVAQAHAGK
jgi:hypothetical protein